MIKKEEILNAQKKWSDAVIKIGSYSSDRELCEKETDRLVDSLYAFDLGSVLFKPTKAARVQFRSSKEGALSYFIGNNKDFPEDKGFATSNPWIKIEFENANMILEVNRGLVMGNYYFTDKKERRVKVEYTFGYQKNSKGELKIDLHHSSLPFRDLH